MTTKDIISLNHQYRRIVENNDVLRVGDTVTVVISVGQYDFSTGKTIRPEVATTGSILKVDSKETDYQGSSQLIYTVKYKNPYSGKLETSEFSETEVRPI